MDDHLIWIDLEMSGLDPQKHVILEIGAIVTDNGLEIVEKGPDIAINYSDHILSSMDEWSLRHHQASGLLDRVKTSSCSSQQAEKETLEFICRYSKKGQSPLCGNSVWQDRRFLAKQMPELEGFLHYRNIDVSSVKELVKRWYPRLPRFEKQKTHLAIIDIEESIRELRYYRENVFAQ